MSASTSYAFIGTKSRFLEVDDLSPDELRWVLDTLIGLAARWDYNTGGKDNVYRANVLIDSG